MGWSLRSSGGFRPAFPPPASSELAPSPTPATSLLPSRRRSRGRPGLGTHTQTHSCSRAQGHMGRHTQSHGQTPHKVTQSRTCDHPPHAAWGRPPADILLPPPLEAQARNPLPVPKPPLFPAAESPSCSWAPHTGCPPVTDAGLPLVDTSYLTPPPGSSDPTPPITCAGSSTLSTTPP